MNHEIDLEINEVIQVMSQRHGIDISMYDNAFLEKSLAKQLVACGIKSTSAYIRYLSENNTEVNTFCNILNITYSEFFRNPLTFAILEQCILPNLIKEKKGGGEIRIWSAACAAGQEAYSIAMMLDQFYISTPNEVRFRIFATDISISALAIAREGVYNADAVQNVKLKLLSTYFEKNGDNYSIVSRLKDKVNFSTYDLLDKSSANPPESIYGNFDIAFCSNLLFYYKPNCQQIILQKVLQSITDKGYLVTGEVEKAIVDKSNGLRVYIQPAPIFQKDNQRGML